MRLLAVEVRRFWSRRGIALVLILTVAAAALLAGSAIWSTRGATEAEVSTAQSQLEAEAAALEGDYQACLDDPPPQPAELTPAERCEELDPQLDWFLPRTSLDLRDQVEGTGLALALILAGAAIVIGTTYAGADWQSRALSTQLLFRPRRLRLWAAKAVAVVLGMTLVSTVVTAAFWLVLWLVAEARGLEVGGDLLGDIALHGARSVVLTAACALGAYALTMALRSTIATLGALFAYTVAGEALWASLPITRSSEWSLAANVQAWLLDGLEVYDDSICAPGEPCDPTYVLSAGHAALYLGVLLLVAVALSLALFPRRDVP